MLLCRDSCSKEDAVFALFVSLLSSYACGLGLRTNAKSSSLCEHVVPFTAFSAQAMLSHVCVFRSTCAT